MKIFAAVCTVSLASGLAFSAAPAAAQHDPPFVARGAQRFVTAETARICKGNGGVSMWPDGRSVLTWSHATAEGSYVILDTEGARVGDGPLGTTAQGSDISTAAYGGFVSAFVHGDPNSTFDLEARIFDPQEVAQLPPPFAFTDFHGRLPAVAAGDDGKFVLAWAVTGPTAAVLAARFDRAGNRIGSDIAVADVAGAAEAVDVTRGPDGSFTVYWRQSVASEGSLLHLRRYAADGAPLGAAVAVAATDPQFPYAAGAADGDAMLVYTEAGTAALTGRRLEADGTLGEAFPIFDQAANPAGRAEAAYLGDGSVAAAAAIQFAGGPASIHLLRFSREGQPLGRRVSVAVPSVPGRQFLTPQLAANGDRLAVFYGRQDEVDSLCFIFVRTFDATLFADSFESGDLSAWNGGP